MQKHNEEILGVKVYDYYDLNPSDYFIVAVRDNVVRKEIYERAVEFGMTATNIISTTAK